MKPQVPAASRPEMSPVQVLRWWSEAGVDLAMDEEPHDRFAEPPPAAPPVRLAPTALAPRPAPRIEQAAAAQPDEAARSAKALAAGAATLHFSTVLKGAKEVPPHAVAGTGKNG